MENKIYWKEAFQLLKNLDKTSEFIEVSSDLKKEIECKIFNSIKDENYLVIKLLIYSKISENILQNFLFYNAINKEKTYNLFLDFPSRYCNTYMFNILPNDLPDLNRIFNDSETKQLNKIIDITNLLKNITRCEINKLKELFPKAFHFASMNPYSKEVY